MEQSDVGILLNQDDMRLHRMYFDEMAHMIGIRTIYRAPRPDLHWDGYGELDGAFFPPQEVYCIFDEHPSQRTTKKLGWVAELQEGNSIIHVPYDLPGLQIGALFIIPSGLDHAKGRVFKVTMMNTVSITPASIACEIAPVYENHFDRGQMQHTDNTENLLLEEDPDDFIPL